MARFEDLIIVPGTRAEQPVATAVPEGTLYSVTDEDNIVERSNGATWVTFAGAGGGGSGTVTHTTGALTADRVIIGNGGDDIKALALGTALQVLRVNAGATAVEFGTASGVPGGSDTQVQYNNAGAFGGITGATTNGTALTLVAPVLGTPASGTLTNCTIPVGGVTGLGTGVGTFLATPSSANLASAVTDETGSGALVFATSPTLVTPALGTPASGTLTNTTGFPAANLAGLGANVATFLATPSSANLAAAVTDETGSGALVFGTSPALTTPNLGTPSAVNLANGTALPLTTGVTGDLPLANLTPASAASKLLGRGSAGGAGDYEEITIGSGLTMIATTLSATGGGTGDVVGPASSVASEIVLFDGTTGKLIKAATGTGPVKATSGVYGTGNIDLASEVTGDLPFASLAQGSALSVLGVTGNATADNASIAAGTDHQVLRRSGTAVAFGAVNLAQSAAVTGTLPSANLPTAVTTRSIGITIDGGGATITTGIKGDIYVAFTCTITAVTMLADQSGSIVVDIWKDTYGNYPPTVADTITASAKPTITTAVKSQDTTLTGWTTAVTAGDSLRFNVDSATTVTRVTLVLTVTV